MEKIINNPGLQHLAENIFLNLNYADLNQCQLINQSASDILDNPLFWIKKLIRNFSKENQMDWFKAIRSETTYGKKKYILAYLNWNFKKKNSFNLPCYTKSVVQENFRKKIQKKCHQWRPSNEDTEIVKILAPLTDNPNASDGYGNTYCN